MLNEYGQNMVKTQTTYTSENKKAAQGKRCVKGDFAGLKEREDIIVMLYKYKRWEYFYVLRKYTV